MSSKTESIAAPRHNSPALSEARRSRDFRSAGSPINPEARTGCLIINADDWGRDRQTTDRTLECYDRGAISSVSAMVFMEDSERAAALARENRIDTGLHLNFTTAFSARTCPTLLAQHQQRISRRLLCHRLAQVIFHPDLINSFNYAVSAQLDEYCRLYADRPQRLDGHHHMHLCANIVFGKLLPCGTAVRRSLSLQPGEKSLAYRLQRRAMDRIVSRQHRLTDFFFSLKPLEPSARLERIFSLASQFIIEVETHPVNPEEYRFLAQGEIFPNPESA
jgi:chitin disaccharide deacetylase